jgi:hypothetical protein
MRQPTLTHDAPWEDDDTARCGVPVTDARSHSLTPTCPVCAAALAAEDAAVELMALDTPFPLDADEARDLDPLLNAGLPDRPAPPFDATTFVADLFEFAVTLTRANAQRVRGGRR